VRVLGRSTAPSARSISWHLGLAGVLLVLPATAFFGWVLWHYVAAEQRRLESQGLELTRSIRGAVEQELAWIMGTARLTASAPRLSEGPLAPELMQQTAVAVARSVGVDFVLRDPSGQQIVNTRKSPGLPLPQRPLEIDRTVLATKQAAVSSLFMGAFTGGPSIAVVAPVLRPDNGEVHYLADLVVPAERFRDAMLKVPLGAGLYATVLDRSGQVIARTRAHEQFVGVKATEFMRGATGAEGYFRTTSLDGVPIVVQYSRVSGADWIVAVGLEQATLDAPVWRLLVLLLAGGLCLALLSVTLAYLFGRRIAEAVQALSDSAIALGQDAPVPVLATPITEVNQVNAALVRAGEERRQAEETRALMVRELHHRVKNTLATVQAVVSSTARMAGTIAEFRQAVTDRIGALAKTHTLLVDNAWGGAALRDILWAELEPYDTEHRRVTLEGPDAHVPAEVALAFGMAVHELTTNAAKYGALSLPAGRVHVSWSVQGKGDGRRLVLEWHEQDGPPVQPLPRRGFGSMLLERVLGQQLQGEVESDFRPEGLHVSIKVPLPQRPEPRQL
jgi:two-component sensor histidine kinase